MLIRILLTCAILTWVLLGFVVLVTPIPFGVVMIAAGLGCWLAIEPSAHRLCRYLRTRYSGLNRGLHALERAAPEWVQRLLRSTHPQSQVTKNRH